MSEEDISKMKNSCRLASEILAYTGDFVKPGVSTNKLDQIAHEYTLSRRAFSAPLNYKGFPKSICTSVNECICHGVPSDRILKEGDIVNIDITCIKEGFHGDTSATFLVGESISDKARNLTKCAFEAMWRGIRVVTPHGHTGDIGFSVEKYVKKKDFYVVKEIGGHGIGEKFHTEPFVPSFGKKGRGEVLKPWTCITVEPMINETGTPLKSCPIPDSEIEYFETSDKTLSAQFEHTILITDEAYEILTYNEKSHEFFLGL